MKPAVFLAPILVGCIVGCTQEPAVRKYLPVQEVAHVDAPAPRARKMPRRSIMTRDDIYMKSGKHIANEATHAFVVWADQPTITPMWLILNDNGDCVELRTHPCWHADDEALKQMMKLPQLQAIWLNAQTVTDEQLRHFELMPALTQLHLHFAEEITEDGLARLQAAKPELQIEITFSKRREKPTRVERLAVSHEAATLLAAMTMP